ncbi:MAG: IS3 family transposase [Candidatus Tyrphobacter sp.]
MRYKSCKAADDELVRDRLRCLVQERPRFGWRRLKILLKREKIIMNHKRLRRIYRQESLQVRPRKKRRVRPVRGNTAPPPTKLNEEWGLDFMNERLLTRRKVRVYLAGPRLVHHAPGHNHAALPRRSSGLQRTRRLPFSRPPVRSSRR